MLSAHIPRNYRPTAARGGRGGRGGGRGPSSHASAGMTWLAPARSGGIRRSGVSQAMKDGNPPKTEKPGRKADGTIDTEYGQPETPAETDTIVR